METEEEVELEAEEEAKRKGRRFVCTRLSI